MSVAENLDKRTKDIGKISKYVEYLTVQSDTGVKLIESGMALAESGKMDNFISLLSGSRIGDEERVILLQRLQELQTIDPQNAMQDFAEMLGRFAEKTSYKEMAAYYGELSEAATAVSNSQEFKDSMNANQNFERDDSEAAIEAREAIAAMQRKVKEWSQDLVQ